MREICYQRMLIEQRADIHLSFAKLLQNVKFSYIPHEMEMKMIHKHLKITEKSIITFLDLNEYRVIIESLSHYLNEIDNININSF